MYLMCKKCGFFYEENGDGCPMCGNKDEVSATPNTTVTTSKSSTTEYDNDSSSKNFSESTKSQKINDSEHKCENCGNIQPKYFNMCLNCGSMINNEEQDNLDEREPETAEYEFDEYEDLGTEIESESKDDNPEFIMNPENTFNFDSNGYCSSDNEDYMSDNLSDSSDSSKTEGMLGEFKKAALFILGVIFFLVITVVVLDSSNNKRMNIDINDYIVNDVYTDEFNEYLDYRYGLRIYGYNDYATLDTDELKNVVDWDRLERDVNEKLSHQKKYEGRDLIFNDFFDWNSFEFRADKTEHISNGDVIYVDVIAANSYTFNGITINVVDGRKSYNIFNLKEVKSFNPFDYVHFIQYNANGYASVGVSVDEDLNKEIDELDGFKVTYYDNDTIALEKDDYIIAKIEFYFSNDVNEYHNYKNGETVTMYCSCSNYSLAEEYNIYIGTSQKDYTFRGLGEYITKSTTISQEQLDKFINYSQSKIKEKYGSYDYYSNFNYNSAYIVDLKDKTVLSSSFHNNLCMVFSYTYKNSWTDTNRTEYLCIIYKNLIANDIGTIKFEPEDYYCTNQKGYNSVDEILSYQYNSDYNIVKV